MATPIESPGVTRRSYARTDLVGRSSARLMAVQALYQMELMGAAVDSIVEEFVGYRLTGGDMEGGSCAPANKELFVGLVHGVAGATEELNMLIAEFLPDQWSLKRLELILLSILKCGAYELRSCMNVPPKVTITEYVDVAHSFYGGKEPGMVNAVLDRLARELRSQEMATVTEQA